jgi:hypothetical protein
MTEEESAAHKVEEVLRDHGLSRDSMLYRESLETFLERDDAGHETVTANADPSEAVVNVYEGGHVALAAQIGPGLAFTERRDNQWREEGRVTVAVRLGDVLDQGGMPYPVESVITEPVWYVTLPAGQVRVTRA